MLTSQIDHLVQQRLDDRRAATDRHRLVAIARRRQRQVRPVRPTCQPVVATGDLAVDLATFGPDAVELRLLQVARTARALGITPALVDVLADRTAPAIARQRAFARITIAIARDADVDVEPVAA